MLFRSVNRLASTRAYDGESSVSGEVSEGGLSSAKSVRSLDNFAMKVTSPSRSGGRFGSRFKQSIATRDALLRMARKLFIFSDAQVTLLESLVACDIEIAQLVYKWFFTTLQTYVDNGRCKLSSSQLKTLKSVLKRSMEDKTKEDKVTPTTDATAMFSVGFCIEEESFDQACSLWYTNYLLKLPSVSYTLRCMVEAVTSKLSPDDLPVSPIGLKDTFHRIYHPMKNFSYLGAEVTDSQGEKCWMVRTPSGIQQFLEHWFSLCENAQLRFDEHMEYIVQVVKRVFTHRDFMRLRAEAQAITVALESQEQRHLPGEPKPLTADLVAIQKYYENIIQA